MTIYGLTDTGFVPKTLDVVRSELIASFQNLYGPSIDTSNNSFLGNLLSILSEREALLWDLAQSVNASLDPDAATFSELDSICAITGTFRLPAKPSSVTLTLTGTPGTTINAASQSKTLSTESNWNHTTSGTIVAVSFWAISTVYTKGTRVKNASRVYECTVAGTSAGSGGPLTTLTAIVDNTVTWRYLGEGTGAVDVSAQCTVTGPVFGASGDIQIIQTPVSGWSSVTNLLDASLGNNVQSDESLRVLRDAELAQAGVADPEAIRSSLLQITGVTNATVFVNNTDYNTGSVPTNDLMTPHSVESLVLGGSDQTILDTLFSTVAAGIAFIGNTVGNTIDSQLVSQVIKFSRPTSILAYASLTLVKDPAAYPANGDAQVKAALVSYGQKQSVGKDCIASSVSASIFPVYVNGVLVAGVPGVLDVTACTVGVAPSPVGSSIAASNRQLIVHDTSRIVLTTSNGTP